MTLGDLILALLPPAGAMLVERVDLVNREYLLRDAATTLRNEGQPEDKTIKEIIALSAEGASEIVGLAPTFVSAVASGFAILKEVQQLLWPTVIYISTIMVLTLMVIKLLRGRTCHAIVNDPRVFFKLKETTVERTPKEMGNAVGPTKRRRNGLERTSKEMISYMIYTVNVALIILAVSVFLLTLDTQEPLLD